MERKSGNLIPLFYIPPEEKSWNLLNETEESEREKKRRRKKILSADAFLSHGFTRLGIFLQALVYLLRQGCNIFIPTNSFVEAYSGRNLCFSWDFCTEATGKKKPVFAVLLRPTTVSALLKIKEEEERGLAEALLHFLF